MKTYVYKVVLLGNNEVGKTTLFKKLRDNCKTGKTPTSFCDSLELTPYTLEIRLVSESTKILVGRYIISTGYIPASGSQSIATFEHLQLMQICKMCIILHNNQTVV